MVTHWGEHAVSATMYMTVIFLYTVFHPLRETSGKEKEGECQGTCSLDHYHHHYNNHYHYHHYYNNHYHYHHHHYHHYHHYEHHYHHHNPHHDHCQALLSSH